MSVPIVPTASGYATKDLRSYADDLVGDGQTHQRLDVEDAELAAPQVRAFLTGDGAARGREDFDHVALLALSIWCGLMVSALSLHDCQYAAFTAGPLSARKP